MAGRTVTEWLDNNIQTMYKIIIGNQMKNFILHQWSDFIAKLLGFR